MCTPMPTPPPAPDYAAAATAQGAANVTGAQQTASLSNPNVISPYGNQTVTYADTGPNGDTQPTITQTLTPEAQQTLDAQQRVQYSLANLGQKGAETAQDVLGQPFQYSGPNINANAPQAGGLNYGPQTGQYGYAQSFNPGMYGQAGSVNPNQYGQARGVGSGPSAQGGLDLSDVAKMPVNAGTTGQQAILSRLNPQIQQNEQATAQRLANQGIPVGSEAWNNEMRQQGNQENDLYTQAALQGIGLDTAANQQGYNQALSSAGLYNNAIGQNFSQNLAAAQSRNSAIGQNSGLGLSAQQLYNQAIGQNAGLGLSATGANNAALAQNYGQDTSLAGLYNTAQGQSYNQRLQNAQFGNTAAQQAYQQQLAQYNQPLNEITALMSGSQIQNPQFQSYQGATVAAAPVYQAAQNQAQYGQDLYGQQMSAYNSGINGISGLLGAGLGAAGAAGGFGKLFTF